MTVNQPLDIVGRILHAFKYARKLQLTVIQYLGGTLDGFIPYGALRHDISIGLRQHKDNGGSQDDPDANPGGE